MPRFRVVPLLHDQLPSEGLTIEADSVSHALAIIASKQPAALIELWRGDDFLGRLRQTSAEEGAFWRLV